MENHQTAVQQLSAQTAAAAIKENSNSVNEAPVQTGPGTPSIGVDPMDVLAAAAAKSPTAAVNGTVSGTFNAPVVKPKVEESSQVSDDVTMNNVTVPATTTTAASTTMDSTESSTTVLPAQEATVQSTPPVISSNETPAKSPAAALTSSESQVPSDPTPSETLAVETPVAQATPGNDEPSTSQSNNKKAETVPPTPAKSEVEPPAATLPKTTESAEPLSITTSSNVEATTQSGTAASVVEPPSQPLETPSAQSKAMEVDTPEKETKTNVTDSNVAKSPISTPAEPAPVPVLRPALRGTFKRDADGILEWEGKWGMDDVAFEPGGFLSPFRYRWVKDANDAEIDAKKISNPKGATVASSLPPVPEDKKLPFGLRDCFFSGHFIMRPRGVPSKVEEKHLFFHFDKKDGSDEVLMVAGEGKNKFGSFSLEGELHVATMQLNVYRRYLPKAKKASRARSGSRIRKSLGGLTPSVQAAANAGVLANPIAAAISTGSLPRGLDSSAMVFHPRRPERLKRVPSHLTENDGTNPLGKIANIVHTMMEKDKQSFFCYPVDPIALNIPQYPDIIKQPMDLGTVANNIAEKLYDNELEVVQDVRLTYENAMTFNPPTHAIHHMAKDYLGTFNKLYDKLVHEREIELEKQAAKAKKAKETTKSKTPLSKTTSKKRKSIGSKKEMKLKKKKKKSKAVFSSDDDSDDSSSDEDSSDDSSSDEDSSDSSSDEEETPKKRKKSKKSRRKKKKKSKADLDEVARLKAELKSLKKKVQKKERRESITTVNHTVSAPPTKKRKQIDRPLSYQEKHRLTLDIQKLPEDKIQKIISMIQESGAHLDGDENEVELDIDALETPALRKLQKFVRQCLGRS